MKRVETVSFIFHLRHFYYSDLHFTLTSPMKTKAVLRSGAKGERFSEEKKHLETMEFVILSREFFGEKPNGT